MCGPWENGSPRLGPDETKGLADTIDKIVWDSLKPGAVYWAGYEASAKAKTYDDGKAPLPTSEIEKLYNLNIARAQTLIDAPAKAPPLATILAEREARYGGFKYNAAISQGVKDVLRRGRQWDALTPEMKEALEMIANKLCRIVAGKAEYRDSWDDIAGYATLVAETLGSNA